MARCLNAYDWAEEPLNAEVPYQSDDIIVENSDIDESPQKKAERNRRREAIGRRYLLGHIPLIQTASLRGPFGSKSGWVAPWGHIKACLKDKRPSTSARNHNGDTNTRETIDTESDTLAVEKFAEAAIEEDSLDKHIDDDAVRYDADNEDDAFEETNDEELYLLHSLEHLDGSRATHTCLFHGEPQTLPSDDNFSDALEKDSVGVIKHNGSEDSGRKGKSPLQNKKKRKVDTGWLKGANVLKRSRYEVLEHSSPTPVAGAIREGNIGLQGGSSLRASDKQTLDVQDHSQLLPIPTISKHATPLEATKETSTLPGVFESHNDISWEVTKEITGKFLVQNRQSVATDCEEVIHDIPAQEDINVVLQASQRQPIFTQPPGRQQLEVAQLSPSDLDLEDIKTLSSTRRLSHKGVQSTSPRGENQDFDYKVHSVSVTSDAIADEGIILSHLDDMVDFHDTPSPTSEDSFHYRRTCRKSQGQKSNQHRQKGDENTSAAGRDVGTLERDTQAIEPTDGLSHHSRTPVSSDNARTLEAQKSATSRTKKGGRRQHGTASPVKNLDALSELGIVSSPDPLSEDFENGHRQQTTPDIDQSLGQKPSQDDIEAVDFQPTIVTQASPPEYQHAGGTQQSSPQALLQLSKSIISKDHMEMSTSLTDSIEGRNSDFHAKQSVLPVQAEDLDETILAEEYHFNRRLKSQPESPEEDKATLDLSDGLQKVDVLATQPISFKGNTEPSQSPGLYWRVESSSESAPTRADVQVLEEPARSTQSPWTAVGVKSLPPDLLLDTGSSGSKRKMLTSVTRRHLKDLPIDQAKSVVFASTAEEEFTIDDTDKNGEECFKIFQSLFKHSTKSSDELYQPPQRFPSTQTLVDAATANPWNSAFKKPRTRKSNKRVSFGPLPSEEVDAARDAFQKPLERMGSPPPPAGTLRLTQLDDPFHYRLKATRDLEVTEESLTKFMNTPWDDIPVIKPRAKPPSSSPAVAAMAEAFIAADEQNFNKRISTNGRSMPARLISARTKATESFQQPRVWTAPERLELRSSSPPDASFSIAPNGKVTAVSIEAPVYDAEDNLHSVIEDMGSFLEGWDVESELKKAKGHKFEKSNDIKVPRKREYLSGVSNR